MTQYNVTPVSPTRAFYDIPPIEAVSIDGALDALRIASCYDVEPETLLILFDGPNILGMAQDGEIVLSPDEAKQFMTVNKETVGEMAASLRKRGYSETFCSAVARAYQSLMEQPTEA